MLSFEEIIQILQDKTRTDYQRAADLHAALTKAATPSALTIKPMKERAKRGPNKPKEYKVTAGPLGVSVTPVNGHDAGETQQ